MRILHVTPTYLPATRYGGPIYSVHGLAKAQAARGDDVHVYTTNVDGDGVSPVPVGSAVELDGVRVCYFPCGVGRRLYRSPALGLSLERNMKAFDVAHVHSAFLWPSLVAARTAERSATPYVFSPRGMLSPKMLRAKSALLKSIWLKIFDRHTVNHAAAVHFTSDAERDELERTGLRPRKAAVIANGIDIRPFERPANASGEPVILSLGRISWKKGIDRLIRAFALTRNAKLVIAGNDDESLSPRLQELSKELGCEARVTFAGPVLGEEKFRLIQSATIFALASHSENFGNAVLEAMACAVPVIVTPEVGLAKSVARLGAGVVASGDAETFAAALKSLLDDPAKRSALGMAGRAAAEKEFAWGAIAAEMDALYRSIL